MPGVTLQLHDAGSRADFFCRQSSARCACTGKNQVYRASTFTEILSGVAGRNQAPIGGPRCNGERLDTYPDGSMVEEPWQPLWPARDLSSMASNSALRHMPGSLMSYHDESRLQVYLAASGILVPAGLESARRRRDTASKHWVAFARHSRRRRMVTRSGRYTLPCLLLCAVQV